MLLDVFRQTLVVEGSRSGLHEAERICEHWLRAERADVRFGLRNFISFVRAGFHIIKFRRVNRELCCHTGTRELPGMSRSEVPVERRLHFEGLGQQVDEEDGVVLQDVLVPTFVFSFGSRAVVDVRAGEPVREVDPLEVGVDEVPDFEHVVGDLVEEEQPLVNALEARILSRSDRLSESRLPGPAFVWRSSPRSSPSAARASAFGRAV